MSYIYYNDILYATIDNYNNSMCFIISCIHLLHSSETLNRVLTSKHTDPNDTFLRILKTYALITANSRSRVQDSLNYLISAFYDDYIIPSNYSYIDFMCYYCLPKLYCTFPEYFDQILADIYFYEIFLDKYKYSYTKSIRELIKEEHIKECLGYYAYFISSYTIPKLFHISDDMTICRPFEIRVHDNHCDFYLNVLNMCIPSYNYQQ